MSALVLFGSFFVLLLLTVPIGYAIGISSLIAIYYYSDIPLIIIAQKAITGVDSFPLLAIPFFMLQSDEQRRDRQAPGKLFRFPDRPCYGRTGNGYNYRMHVFCGDFRFRSCYRIGRGGIYDS